MSLLPNHTPEPDEYKMVIGLGYPAIPSRFKDPDDPENSFWKPSSVPSVRGKAQSWRANYRNDACGIRKLDDDMTMTDPVSV